MARERSVSRLSTRREILKGGAVIGGGLLAGCAGDGGGSTETAAAGTATRDETVPATEASSTEAETETATETATPYEVTVEPAGSHTFEAVPETYASIPGAWMDMAMGFGIRPSAVAAFGRHPMKYYEALGVEFDTGNIRTLGETGEEGYDKEILYEVDADVHLADPRMMKRYSGWDDADLEEIRANVGPILGSLIRFPYRGHDPYYTLYEAFEKVAQIFQRREQYEAWVEVKDALYSDIRSRTPATGDDAPTVAAFNFGFDVDAGSFYAANINAARNDTRHFRLLGVDNAFESDEFVPFKQIGQEEVLEIDPDYIGTIGYLSYIDDEEFRTLVEKAQAHETIGTLTAVQEGNFVRTGGQYMGPIVDLFSAEATAKQLYPEEYGEWPGSVGDVPEEEQLFDRQRVVDIIDGDL